MKLINTSICSTHDIDTLVEGRDYVMEDTTSQHRLIVLNDSNVESIIKEIHIEQSHGGRDKVETAFHKKYYYIGLRKAVQHVLENCSCMNTKKNNTVAPLLTVRTVNALERVHGDLMDAGDGKTWCSIVDNFSKVAVTAVIPSKTPENVIKTFKLFIAKYGKPKEIQWDNGSEQRGVFPAWCEKKAIKLVNSSVGHPQSNGKVERYQQSIMSMAIAVKQVKGGTVSDHLDEVVVAYNNRPHSSLGKFTPAYVFSTCLSDATEQILNLRLQISKHQQQVHSRDAKRRAKAKNCEKIAARDHVFIFAGDKHHNKGEPRYKYKAEIVERYGNHTCRWDQINNLHCVPDSFIHHEDIVTTEWMILPTVEDQMDILREAHGVYHVGVKKMMPLIRQNKYLLPNAQELCTEFRKCCSECAFRRRKTTITPFRIVIPNYPLHHIYIDLAFLPQSNGNIGIVNLIDHLTKKLWTKVITNKRASTVRAFLDESFEDMGLKKDQHYPFVVYLRSDNGGEFVNREVAQICEEYGVESKQGPAYSPWVQGAVERVNQTIKIKVKVFLRDQNVTD